MDNPRWLGIVVAKQIVAVDAEVPKQGSIIIQADSTWTIQSGDVGKSYATLYGRIADYVKQNGISRVIIKASGALKGSMRLAHLEAAERRGIAIAAAASICDVKLFNKSVASRMYGERKVDDYLADSSFMEKNFSGDLRRGSREAAFLLIYSREQA